MLVCYFDNRARQVDEVFDLQPKRADGVFAMAIEAGARDDELRADFIGNGRYAPTEKQRDIRRAACRI